jgi:hypothetical protein
MAMNPTDMAEAIYSELEAAYWPDKPLPSDAEAEAKAYYKVLSTAIINYMKANVDVLPGTFAAAGSNVMGTGNVS